MIALDAMGGDFAPEVVVQAAINAAYKGIAVTLYGNAFVLYEMLSRLDARWSSLSIAVVDCKEEIGMAEEPTRAVLKKNDASMVRAIEAVAHGNAQAFVTAGNSGAALAASLLKIGRVQGLLRPALATFIPTKTGSFFCLDIGANVDCKPDYLVQFAYMGSTYVQTVCGIAQPRVALLSNGHEPYKGSLATKQAFKVLSERQDITFVGNIEPRDIFDSSLDVLVCDGFAGNVMLKAVQGAGKMFSHWLKEEQKRSLFNRIGFFLARGAFMQLKKKSDYAKTGGALLLGVKQPVIVAHGSSNALAIENALLLADHVIRHNTYERVNALIYSSLKKHMPEDAYMQNSLNSEQKLDYQPEVS